MEHGLEIINGSETINLKDLGFSVDAIRINAPEQENIFAEIEGISGRSLQSSVHKSVTIEVDVFFDYSFELDFPILRDKLMAITSNLKPFYIRELRAREFRVAFERPGEKTGRLEDGPTEYADGKRYKVLRTGTTTFEEAAMRGKGTITFETVGVPYAESVGTSMDIQRNGIRYSDGLWSYGMNLTADQSTWKYSFTNSATSRFYNPSDVDLDSFKMDKVIKITFNSSSSYVKLTDHYGNVLRIDKAFTSGDVLTIDKHYIKQNGNNITGYATQLTFPTIYRGWNNFKIEGPSAFTVDFDFRFYYGGGIN